MPEQKCKHILLIDDDSSLLVTLGDFLRFEGYQVTAADSGEEGLRQLAKLTPDLIVLDMSMPGMGGIGFLKAITGDAGKLRHPVLVLTARANMAEFFADVEVDGFVAKPCDPADLLLEIGRIVFLRGTKGSAGGEGARKVMLGEDDVRLVEPIASALREAGCAVKIVTAGPDLVEQAVMELPDVILVKLVFGRMNGDSVARILGEMPKTRGVPVIIYDDSGVALSARKYAVSAAVRKFVPSADPMDLVAAVNETFRKA